MLNAFNSSYSDQELEPNKIWGNWLNIFTTIAHTHAPLIIHVGSRHNLNKIIEGPIIKIGDQLVNRVYTTKSLECYR